MSEQMYYLSPEGFPMPLPKIFFFVDHNNSEENHIVAIALAEDGTGLAGHICSSRGFVRGDMGVGVVTHRKHAVYLEHFPSGFEMVDLIDADEATQAAHAELQIALARNKAQLLGAEPTPNIPPS